MANSLYDAGRNAFLRGSIAGASGGWLGATAKLLLLSSYNVDLAANVFRSDIPAGQIAGVSTYLANKTAAAGVADADDTILPGVSWAATIVAAALIHDSGASNTSLLIGYVDTASVLPALLNAGLDLTWQFDAGANRIFKL